jgi:DNA-directed RNA polymerase specialized sigma24 family protein
MCSDAVQDSPPTTAWCEALYEAQATPLVLYGRALGLSHGEAEDVLQDVFRELLKRDDRPHRPEHYLVRAFRNRALNYRRSLWRRVAREFESGRWFERAPDESPRERAAMRCLATLLELSPNTAAGRYRYGLQKLRACLREPLPETEHELAGSFGDPDFNLDTPPPVPGA